MADSPSPHPDEMIPRNGYDYPTTAEVLAGGQEKGAGFDRRADVENLQ